MNFAILFYCFVNGITAFEIHLITIINGENLSYGYTPAAPMYDVAFEHALKQYPKVFALAKRTFIYTNGTFSCADSGALMLTVSNRIYQAMATLPNAFTALFCPGTVSMRFVPLKPRKKIRGIDSH